MTTFTFWGYFLEQGNYDAPIAISTKVKAKDLAQGYKKAELVFKDVVTERGFSTFINWVVED